jgi:hypothetical protein
LCGCIRSKHFDNGHSYLVADFSIDCKSSAHQLAQIVAGIMMVYPFGTPLLFAYILWYNREQLQSIRDGDHAVTNGLTATVPDNKIPLALKLVRFIKPLEPTKSAEGSVMEGRAKLAKGVMVKADKDQEPGRTGLAPEVRALTNDYRLDCYWWELVECLRKVLLTGLFIFYKKGSLEQLALGLLVCLFFIQAYHNVKPYASAALPTFDIRHIAHRIGTV